MECKYCKENIKDGATVCPHCKRYQTPDGLVVALVIFIVLFLLISFIVSTIII